MKIYCAGKWKEREQVKKIMEMLEARGHTITCDWTKHIAPEIITQAHEKGLFNKSYDWSNNEDFINNGYKTYAQEDLEGVENCDLLVAYMPDPDVFYKGAWVEIGIAIAHRKRVVIIGTGVTSVFLSLNLIIVVRFKEDALSFIDSIQFDKDYEEGSNSKQEDVK